MWLFVFVFLFAANPNLRQESPKPAQSPSLIVQVVDPAWFPIPGAEVKVEPLARGTQSYSTRTDKDGYAKFSVPADADYAIEAESHGFKNARLKRMHLFKPNATFPTAYVQLQQRVLESGTKVY